MVKAGAFVYYAEYVVKTKAKHLYAKMEELIVENKNEILVAWQAYIAFAVLAIVNWHKGNKDMAREYKNDAEQAALTEHSGLPYHPTAGLVKSRDKKLEKMLKKIK